MGISASNISKEVAFSRAVSELSTRTKMDKKVIRPFYRQFLKKHPNGHLNVTDFVEMFPLGVAKAVFRAVDTNVDGRVSFEEYLLALKALEGSEDQWLEWLFRLFDMSGDELISCDEVQAIFDATDETSDEQGGTSEMRARALVKKMDSNGDGVLTIEEFVQGAKRDPNVMQVLSKVRCRLLDRDQ